MALDAHEAFALAMKALELAKVVDEAIKVLPPKGERNAVDYARAFGAADGSPLLLTAALIDQADRDIKD